MPLPFALALVLLAEAPAAAPPVATAPPAAAATPAPPAPPPGEPLPASAPSDPYELTAWCYGAMSEYLEVYDRVKPDLRAIDKLFGTSVKDEADPYAADMAAARTELKVLAGGVEAAEKASAEPIAPRGLEAIKKGRSVWVPAETKGGRPLADAWLTWALPDKCDSVARGLASRSAVLGAALSYNTPATPPPPAPAPAATPDAGAPPAAAAAPPAAATPPPAGAPYTPPAAQASPSAFAPPPN